MSSASRTSVVIDEEQALDLVSDGMTVAIGGFNTAAHPMVIVRGLIRRGVRRLRLVGGTIAGLELDLLIGAGVADEVVTSAVTGEALASTGPFFRAAAESGGVRVWESDEGILYAGLRAAGQGLPFMPLAAPASARSLPGPEPRPQGLRRPDRRSAAPRRARRSGPTLRSSTSRAPIATGSASTSAPASAIGCSTAPRQRRS